MAYRARHWACALDVLQLAAMAASARVAAAAAAGQKSGGLLPASSAGRTDTVEVTAASWLSWCQQLMEKHRACVAYSEGTCLITAPPDSQGTTVLSFSLSNTAYFCIWPKLCLSPRHPCDALLPLSDPPPYATQRRLRHSHTGSCGAYWCDMSGPSGRFSPRIGSRCHASGDVYQLFHSVGWLAPYLVAELGGLGAQTTMATVPLLRLLASDAASSLKTTAQRGSGSSDLAAECVASMRVLISWGVCCWNAPLIPVLPPLVGNRGGTRQARQVAEEAAKAAAPALICLLLPRLAALSTTDMGAVVGINTLAKMPTGLQWDPDRSLRVLTSSHAMQLLHGCLMAVVGGSVAEGGSSGGGGSSGSGGDVSDGTGSSLGRSDMHQAVGSLGGFACILAGLVRQLVTRGCDGAPLGSPLLRDLLARPVLQLLNSPLLDLLARMQHVPVDTAWATVIHSAPCPCPPPGERAPVRQTPMQADDADGARLEMQVRWANGLGVVMGCLPHSFRFAPMT